MKWLDGGAYTTLQPSKAHKGASDLVRCDAAGKSEVLVPAEKLIPPDAKEPLAVHGYELSKDLDLVLIYTNSVKVWRQNTRGDYWTFRRSTGKLAKLGGDAKPSTLMFAKLSPDGTRVGYVRENNLYVEPADGGAATQLTTDGIGRGHQRHLRLGVRGGVLLPRRLALEPGRQADRVLAARHPRREDVHADRQHDRRRTRS